MVRQTFEARDYGERTLKDFITADRSLHSGGTEKRQTESEITNFKFAVLQISNLPDFKFAVAVLCAPAIFRVCGVENLRYNRH
jgi:hypothetical protein